MCGSGHVKQASCVSAQVITMFFYFPRRLIKGPRLIEIFLKHNLCYVIEKMRIDSKGAQNRGVCSAIWLFKITCTTSISVAPSSFCKPCLMA
jgi:hypothetical protein